MGKYDALFAALPAASPPAEPVEPSIETAEQRRQAIRESQNPVENFMDEVKELPTSLLQAGAHFGKTALEQAKQTDRYGDVGANVKEFVDVGLPAVGRLAKANVESIARTVKDPVKSLHDRPLESLMNVASIAAPVGAGVRVAKTAGTTGKALAAADLIESAVQAVNPIPLPSSKTSVGDALRPSSIPKELAKQVSKVSPTAAGMLLDPTADIPEDVLATMRRAEDLEPVKQLDAVERVRELIGGLKKGEQGEVRDLLAAESARGVLPDLPERVYRMQRFVREGKFKGEHNWYDRAEFENDFVVVENALKQRKVRFVDDGTVNEPPPGGVGLPRAPKPPPSSSAPPTVRVDRIADARWRDVERQANKWDEADELAVRQASDTPVARPRGKTPPKDPEAELADAMRRADEAEAGGPVTPMSRVRMAAQRAAAEQEAKLRGPETPPGIKRVLERASRIQIERDAGPPPAEPSGLTPKGKRDLGSPAFILRGGSPVDPAKVEVEPLDRGPEFAKKMEKLSPAIEGVRRLFVEIASDAKNVDAGNGKPLISEETFRRHLASYTPDVRKDVVGGVDTGKRGEGNLFTDLAGDPAALEKQRHQGFAAADFKHRVDFEKRVEHGATDDLEFALTAAVTAQIHDVEKYRLFEALAKRGGKGADAVAVDGAEGQRLGLDHDPRWTKMPDEVTEAGLPRWGALGGMYVRRSVAMYLQHVSQVVDDASRASHGIWKDLRRFRNAWASSKVILNLPSHLNNLVANVAHQIVDGGMLGALDYAREIGKSIARGVAGAKRGDDPFFDAAQRAGIIKPALVRELDNAVVQAFAQGGLWEGVKAGVARAVRTIEDAAAAPAQTAKWAAQAARSPLRMYEWVAKENALAQQLGRMFGAVDNANRLAVFRRLVEAEALERGLDVAEALADPAVIELARARVDRFAYRYDNVPLLLQQADKHGALVFTRYAWKSVWSLLDAVVARPDIWRTSQNASDAAYDDMSARDRELRKLQPPYTKGRLEPVSDDRALQMTYWSPYNLVPEIGGVKEKGRYDAGYFRPLGVDDVLSGPLKSTADVVRGRDPQFGRDLEPGVLPRVGALLDVLAPGQAYHVRKKLVPAIEAEAGIADDKRGRKLSVGDALAQQVGVRLEQRQDGRVRGELEASYGQRVTEIERDFARKLRDETDPAKRAALIRAREAELRALRARRARLLR